MLHSIPLLSFVIFFLYDLVCMCVRACVYVCVCVSVYLMILDYNKLLVKRSNIVVYSSLQSPLLAAPDRGCVFMCVYVCLLHNYTSRYMPGSNLRPSSPPFPHDDVSDRRSIRLADDGSSVKRGKWTPGRSARIGGSSWGR